MAPDPWPVASSEEHSYLTPGCRSKWPALNNMSRGCPQGVARECAEPSTHQITSLVHLSPKSLPTRLKDPEVGPHHLWSLLRLNILPQYPPVACLKA